MEADKIRATLRVSKYMKDTRVERSMCITETSGYDWDGELDEDSKCHGMGQQIMKGHEWEHYELGGEFEHGKLVNGDEVWRHKDGKIEMYVWEHGEKIEHIVGHEDKPGDEHVTDLRN